MARIDRVARWIARDILAERGVEETPAAVAALLPVSYAVAEGVVKALSAVVGDMAAELAGATVVIRCPVAAGRLAADLEAWEAEMTSERPDEGGL